MIEDVALTLSKAMQLPVKLQEMKDVTQQLERQYEMKRLELVRMHLECLEVIRCDGGSSTVRQLCFAAMDNLSNLACAYRLDTYAKHSKSAVEWLQAQFQATRTKLKYVATFLNTKSHEQVC